MSHTKRIWGTTWRAILVGAGYVLAVIASGIATAALGFELAAPPGSESILLWMFMSGTLLAFFLGPLASRMAASRSQHFSVWVTVVFFNMGSVAIEGAIFAPELVPIPLPTLIAQQLLASAVVALLITRLFSRPARSTTRMRSLRLRPWYSWAWRLIASSLAYLFLYFVVGSLSYGLVTRPYYEAHAGGLTAPSPEVVWAVESVRAPLIVLSVALFVLYFQAPRRRLALTTGVMLFWVGGLVPLLFQVNALPLPLLVASGVEIFLQNFPAGAIAALLLQLPLAGATHPTSAVGLLS
jgi:hypothetical protein